MRNSRRVNLVDRMVKNGHYIFGEKNRISVVILILVILKCTATVTVKL